MASVGRRHCKGQVMGGIEFTVRAADAGAPIGRANVKTCDRLCL